MKNIFLRPSLSRLTFVFCFLLQIMAVPHAMAAISETKAKEQYESAKNLIHTYSGSGDNYKQAVALADNIRRADPQSPYSHLVIAELNVRQLKDYGQGDPREILSLTDKVISLNPRIADTYVIRSKISLITGDLKRAQSEADKAIVLDAKNKEAMFAKAKAEEASNRFTHAEGWYRKAIDAHVDPDRKSNIYYWLAQMYLQMTPPQISKADDSMEQSVNLSPDAPWKLVNYAIFLNTKVGNYDKAAKYAEKSLAVMEFPMGRLQLGMARYGKWAMAFTQINNPTSSQLVRARADTAAILKDTGIAPSEAFEYASQYMSQSRVTKALSTVGVN